jgi:hypothetical protein
MFGRIACRLAFVSLGLALASASADAQSCSVGTPRSGTRTIEWMGVGAIGAGFEVTGLGCGMSLVIVPPPSVSSVADCVVGSRLTFSGAVRERDGSPYVHATRARCS